MIVTPIKTHKITSSDSAIFAVLDKYLSDIPERSVVAVSSKIVSICEGRVVPITEHGERSAEGVLQSKSKEKENLIEEEAEWYLPASENPYGVSTTIKHSAIIASAGIDESNGGGYYVLWPEDPQESANKIRAHIAKSKGLKEVGVIITDSKLTPLRWGVTGFGLAHSGFQAINDMVGKSDLFGRTFYITKVNILDGLAASAVYVKGETSEQTPIAVISDIPHIVFQDHNPTKEELAKLKISMEEDIFAPILKKAEWKRGKGSF